MALLTVKRNSSVHRSGYITPYDKQIRKAEDEMTDLALQVQIHNDKLDDHFHKASQLHQFQLRKLRQELQEVKLRAQETKQVMDEADIVHKSKMRKLRMQVVKLTEPTPIRTPNRRKLTAIQKQRNVLKSRIEENKTALSEIREAYQKLKGRNRKLSREVRRRQFAVGFETKPIQRSHSISESF
jgi:chromosome segregation ATPase